MVAGLAMGSSHDGSIQYSYGNPFWIGSKGVCSSGKAVWIPQSVDEGSCMQFKNHRSPGMADSASLKKKWSKAGEETKFSYLPSADKSFLKLGLLSEPSPARKDRSSGPDLSLSIGCPGLGQCEQLVEEESEGSAHSEISFGDVQAEREPFFLVNKVQRTVEPNSLQGYLMGRVREVGGWNGKREFQVMNPSNSDGRNRTEQGDFAPFGGPEPFLNPIPSKDECDWMQRAVVSSPESDLATNSSRSSAKELLQKNQASSEVSNFKSGELLQLDEVSRSHTVLGSEGGKNVKASADGDVRRSVVLKVRAETLDSSEFKKASKSEPISVLNKATAYGSGLDVLGEIAFCILEGNPLPWPVKNASDLQLKRAVLIHTGSIIPQRPRSNRVHKTCDEEAGAVKRSPRLQKRTGLELKYKSKQMPMDSPSQCLKLSSGPVVGLKRGRIQALPTQLELKKKQQRLKGFA